MRTSEKILIVLILIVGFIILYGLSIFMDFSSLRTPAPVGPIVLDEPETGDERKPRAGVALQSSAFTESDLGTPLRQERLETKLRALGPRLQISLQVRQSRLRSELVRRGYQNENFIRYQTLGLDDQLLQESQGAIESSLLREQYGRALSLLEELLDEVPTENLQVRAKILRQSIEIALISGDKERYEQYSKAYFLNLGQTLAIFRNSQLMEFHKAREKIYLLQRRLDSSRSGSLLTILKAIESGGLSPREIVTGLKASASGQQPVQSSDGFRPLSPDIEAATEKAHRLFKNFKR